MLDVTGFVRARLPVYNPVPYNLLYLRTERLMAAIYQTCLDRRALCEQVPKTAHARRQYEAARTDVHAGVHRLTGLLPMKSSADHVGVLAFGEYSVGGVCVSTELEAHYRYAPLYSEWNLRHFEITPRIVKHEGVQYAG